MSLSRRCIGWIISVVAEAIHLHRDRKKVVVQFGIRLGIIVALLTKKEKKGKEELKKETNKYDVLIKLIDRTYDILKSGNIIGIIAVIILLVIWRLPPENLGKQVDVIVGTLTRERYYFFPLSVSLAFCVGIIFYQRKVYKLEIKRLAEVRKALMHGLETKEMKPLESHYPSKYDIEKT